MPAPWLLGLLRWYVEGWTGRRMKYWGDNNFQAALSQLRCSSTFEVHLSGSCKDLFCCKKSRWTCFLSSCWCYWVLEQFCNANSHVREGTQLCEVESPKPTAKEWLDAVIRIRIWIYLSQVGAKARAQMRAALQMSPCWEGLRLEIHCSSR